MRVTTQPLPQRREGRGRRERHRPRVHASPAPPSTTPTPPLPSRPVQSRAVPFATSSSSSTLARVTHALFLALPCTALRHWALFLLCCAGLGWAGLGWAVLSLSLSFFLFFPLSVLLSVPNAPLLAPLCSLRHHFQLDAITAIVSCQLRHTVLPCVFFHHTVIAFVAVILKAVLTGTA